MMDSVLRVPAPAKLNLTLEVTGRLANGYHSIRSLFVRLDAVADVIELRIDHNGNGIYIRSDFPGIPLDAGNLCHLAAERSVFDSVRSISRRFARHDCPR